MLLLVSFNACALPAFAQTTTPTADTSPLAVPLATTIGTLLADPKVEGAHWGISVTQLDGTPIYALNDDQLFHPESNVKLFTTAAALALLGPQYTLHTDVVAEGDLSDNTHLRGNLILRGGGDASFGSHDLPYVEPDGRPKMLTAESAGITAIDTLAGKIAATGLRTIDGDVIGDDKYFASAPYPAGWAEDDLLWGYGAPVSALTIHDNEVLVRVASGGEQPLVSISPDTPYYQLDNKVVSADFGYDCDARLNFELEPGSTVLTVEGDFAPKSKPCTQAIAIHDPAQYAALALKTALEQRGIHIAGAAKTRHRNNTLLGPQQQRNAEFEAEMQPLFDHSTITPPVCYGEAATTGTPPQKATLASQPSAALVQDIKFTNKTSQNLHAELALRNIGAAYQCVTEGTLDGSLYLERKYLLLIGLEKNDFILYDGSGLSTYDLATPRAFTQLLRYAVTQPWGAEWKSSLPIGGVDGTLEDRFTKAPLKGNVFAKTGTSSEDRALSGYLVCASGKTVVFSILATDHLPGTHDDRDVMDKIVAVIAAAN